MDHERLMRRAIQLSREKMCAGDGGPFGAVVAVGDRIVGEGWNQVTSHNDPTSHAEVVAIREACRTLGVFSLEDAAMYTSCEPCPMCLAAVYWARIPRLFYANSTQDAAGIGFDDEALYQELALPWSERRIESDRILSHEAYEVFAEWDAWPGKVPY